MQPRSATALVAALALVLSGCSLTTANTNTPKASGPAKAIGTVVSDFSNDASSNNASGICKDILAASLVAHLDAIGGCSTIITNQLQTVSNYSLTVTKYGVSGNSATALVKAPDNGKNRLYTLHLVKEKGGWRISALTG